MNSRMDQIRPNSFVSEIVYGVIIYTMNGISNPSKRKEQRYHFESVCCCIEAPDFCNRKNNGI
jgi:hypothetical protein